MDYRTEDGSANAGSDYHYSEGTLVFKPGDTRKEIKVSEERKVGPSEIAFELYWVKRQKLGGSFPSMTEG